jgi:UDP-GlcNAc:undecaprenyl-phosphate GlcNAc-1-phosphate transferase
MGTALLLSPIAIRVALRLGIVDHPQPHKFHQSPTPYLGGLAVLGSVIPLFWAAQALPSIRKQAIVILCGAILLGVVGLVDDWRVLKAWPRLASQWAAATGLWAVGIRLSPSGSEPVDYALTVIAVMAITNALNLLDNMNGLVSGTAAIASSFFFIVAAQQGQALVGLMSAMLAGACLGFLPYNLGRARIFLGDAGALSIGFLLAVVAIKIDLDGYPLLTRALVPWLILGVPLFDMVLVVFSRARAGRPIFRGATDHCSHRLVNLGATPQLAAYITYLAATVSGGAALVVLQARSAVVAGAVGGGAIAAAVVIGVLFEQSERARTRLQEPRRDEVGEAITLNGRQLDDAIPNGDTGSLSQVPLEPSPG